MAISGSSSMMRTSVAICRPISLLACSSRSLIRLSDTSRIRAASSRSNSSTETSRKAWRACSGRAASDRAAVMPISSACAAGSSMRVVKALRKHW